MRLHSPRSKYVPQQNRTGEPGVERPQRQIRFYYDRLWVIRKELSGGEIGLFALLGSKIANLAGDVPDDDEVLAAEFRWPIATVHRLKKGLIKKGLIAVIEGRLALTPKTAGVFVAETH